MVGLQNLPYGRSQAEQSKRFRNAVQELVDAGELNHTEAGERFERAMRHIGRSDHFRRNESK